MTIFESNIAFLETHQPVLAGNFKDFVPDEVVKYEGPFPELLKDGELFYGMDAREACRLQVALFFNQPSHYSLKLQNKNNLNSHQLAINNLNKVADELGYSQRGKPKFSNLLLLGAGCGFQLLNIMQHMTLRNVVLVEPDDDMLFHFLCHINLESLCETLDKNGGKFSILQCHDEESFVSTLQAALSHDIGYGFLSEITLFRHYETEFFNSIFLNFIQLRARLLSGWGFFEDECIGLRNSLSNFRHHGLLQTLNNPESELSTTPVLIIGNGPSLDENMEALKNLKDNFLICSCGTALASLLNNDIVPDLHVEMERCYFTALVQKEWLKSDLLNSTILLALSTVPSETTELFRHSLIFTKANDLGGFILNKTTENQTSLLRYCNPTVTNLALSALLKLGFMNITLLGCDYGFRNVAQHHSTGSDYYNKSSALSRSRFLKEFKAEDNFGKAIYTTRKFDQARLNVEKLIRRYPAANIQNGSNGVRICGAPYRDFNRLTPVPVKKQQAKDCLQEIGTTAQYQNHNLKKHLDESLHALSEAITRLRAVATLSDSSEQGAKLLHSLSFWLEQKLIQDVSAVLMAGDIRYFCLLIIGHLNRLNRSELSQYWEAVTHEIKSACIRYEAQLSNIKKGDGYEI